MVQFLSDGGLSKTLSIVLTFLIGCGSAYVVFYQVINGQTPNDIAVGILLAIAGSGVTITGVHTGISSTLTGLNASTSVTGGLQANINPPANNPTSTGVKP